MSYDLAAWVGAQPSSDAEAIALYAQLMERLEDRDADAEPAPEILAYVAALLARWPDITEDDGDDSPWADGPLIGNASGDAIYFSMVWSRADEASEFAASVAQEQGLVCFDPQTETLRPGSKADTSEPRRSWFRRSR